MLLHTAVATTGQVRVLGGQLRPAITPPSTFRIAPVIQLASGESRKTIDGGDVLGCSDPSQRVEAVESLHRLLELVGGDEALVQRRGHHCGRHRVDANAVARQFHGQVVGQGVKAGFRHRVPGRRRRRHRLMGPHAADVDDRTTGACSLHTPNHGLGQEERGPAQLQVRVVVLLAVVEELLGDEEPGRVDQQRRIGVLSGELLLDVFDLLAIREVGSDPPGLALLTELGDRLVDLGLLDARR